MPQTESLAFNDILTFNITSATTQLTSIGDNKKEATTTALSAQGINRKRSSLSFFSNENSTNPNALLNSTIFTNNFFSSKFFESNVYVQRNFFELVLLI
jgi:hypothetical protein